MIEAFTMFLGRNTKAYHATSKGRMFTDKQIMNFHCVSFNMCLVILPSYLLFMWWPLQISGGHHIKKSQSILSHIAKYGLPYLAIYRTFNLQTKSENSLMGTFFKCRIVSIDTFREFIIL